MVVDGFGFRSWIGLGVNPNPTIEGLSLFWGIVGAVSKAVDKIRTDGQDSGNPMTEVTVGVPQVMAWGVEVIKRLIQAQRKVNDIRRHFDETVENCTQLEVRLADLEAVRAEEEREAEAQREALETQGLRLEAQRAALVAEKRSLVAEKEAIRSELDAALVKKTALEVELAETKARAEEEIGRLRSEATNPWGLGKEEFLKSSEFDNLCANKFLDYFRTSFESYVAQFRANGYSEEEHPAPFLSVSRALEELLDEDEEEADEDDEEDGAGATPPSSLQVIVLAGGKPEQGTVLVRARLLHCRFVARAGRAFYAQVELPPEEVPMKIGLKCRDGRAFLLRWGCHPRRCQRELGLSAELVGLLGSRGRATRRGANAELGFSAELVGLFFSGGVAPEESDCENHELRE
ncbi:hypothetical protein F511_37897 [Dorcoceras hygrometricum]|uniref:Uncharacterized protein n=1 Tax=Dorcoceras hygrometricum TaxID=472368 RepID=A0A2Z7BX21_9LAMI|nr:hypothetical protein F511_37897 [Dorcoceras hygrometricum]